MTENNILDKIFRAYDIRGIYPDEINDEMAAKIAKAIVKFLDAKKIVLAWDCRKSSESIKEAVIKSLSDSGVNILSIGLATTPFFYFSVNELETDGGIMITASHNPIQYGGMKIVSKGGYVVGVTNGLKDIESLVNENFEVSDTPGVVEEVDLKNEYIDFVLENSGFKPAKINKFGELSWEPNPYVFKAVVDAGNGMAGFLLPDLFNKFKIDIVSLFWNLDASFPGRGPDPSRKEKLVKLKSKVLETKADIGVAFDGDGDRVIFMNREGEVILSHDILMLFCEYLDIKRVTYDFRMSKSLLEFLNQKNIKAFDSRVGHFFVKQILKQNDADLGGELSGHYFWKEANYTESSLLTMFKVFYVLAKTEKNITDLIAPFQKYAYSGEINFSFFSSVGEIFNKLKEKYSDASIKETDGLTIDYWDFSTSPRTSYSNPPVGRWWFNIRPSNTEPVLRMVLEAENENLMQEKIKEIKSVINIG